VYPWRSEGPAADAINVDTVFDGRGLVWKTSVALFASEAAQRTELSYDALRRRTRIAKPDGTTYTLERTYDALGRMTSETFPDGDVVTYGFNTAGVLEKWAAGPTRRRT
jgi:YD repeat-containing protein